MQHDRILRFLEAQPSQESTTRNVWLVPVRALFSVQAMLIVRQALLSLLLIVLERSTCFPFAQT